MTLRSKLLMVTSALVVTVPQWLSVWVLTVHGLWASIFICGMSPVNGWIAAKIASV
jgi:hypothetical protein